MHQIKFIEDKLAANKTGSGQLVPLKDLAIGEWFIDVQLWNIQYAETARSLCVKIADNGLIGYLCLFGDPLNEAISTPIRVATYQPPELYRKLFNPHDPKAMALPVELWPVRYEDLAPTSSGGIVDFGTWVRDGEGNIFDYAIALSDSEFLGYRTDADHRKPLVDGSIYQCEYVDAQIRPTFVWNIKTNR